MIKRIMSEKKYTRSMKREVYDPNRLSTDDMAARLADAYDEDRDAGERIEKFLTDNGFDWEEHQNLGIDEVIKDYIDDSLVIELYDMIFSNYKSVNDVISMMIEAFKENDCDTVETFEEAGIMTRNKGVVVRFGSNEYQIEINGSY